jgi:hypothetical protein
MGKPIQVGTHTFRSNTPLAEIELTFRKAGYKVIQQTNENIIFEVQGANGKVFYARLQKGSVAHPTDRIVTTFNDGNPDNTQYVNPDGSAITGKVDKNTRRGKGHIHLDIK